MTARAGKTCSLTTAGVVMLAGTIDRFLKKSKPILTCERCGGLCLADLKLSSFARRGLK